MAIQRPGLRPREGTRSPTNPRRRPSAVSLSMTSMIDVLVVLTVFLLITFNASPECPTNNRNVPSAKNVYDVIDAPIVDVRPAGMFLDGTKVSSSEELVTKLKARRAFWKQLNPGKEQ